MTADIKKLEKDLKNNPSTGKKLFLDISAAQYSWCFEIYNAHSKSLHSHNITPWHI